MDKIAKYLKLIKEHPWLMSPDSALLKIVIEESELRTWQRENNIELGLLVEDKYITLLRDLVEFPNGHRGGYNRIINSAVFRNGGMGVAILPIFENKIVLLKIFRHPTRQWSLEVPRGFGEANLTLPETARKELDEEIQGNADQLIDLGPLHSNSGLEGNEIRLFFARLSSYGHLELNEGINEVELVEMSKFEKLISNATITDSFTIAAYTRSKLLGLV